MSFLHSTIRNLPRPLVLLPAAGALVILVAQANGAERHMVGDWGFQVAQATPVADVVAVAPISAPLEFALKAGYSVVCDSVVKAQGRGGRAWTISRTYRYSTALDGGETVITYDVLNHKITGDVRQRVEDAGSGFKVVLSEAGDIVGKDVWVNPDYRWGKSQREKRIAGLNREINWTVGVSKKLSQDGAFWNEEVSKEMATELLLEFDSAAKLNKFSDGTTVQGVGTLSGEKVIVIEGLLRQSGFARGISVAINDQIRSLRYLESGLPAGEVSSRKINNTAETHDSNTTCVQSKGI